MDGARLLMQRVAVNVKGDSYGWPSRSVIFIFAVITLYPSSVMADASIGTYFDTYWLGKVLIALGTIFIAQAIIPLIKSWHQARKLRFTYRNYLLVHVNNTLEHFQGAGLSHLCERHSSERRDSDWLRFLVEHNLEIPEIFISVETVITKALSDDKYIPSVSYLGLEGNLLDHTSPIWSLDGPESIAALEYFLTQQQVETALDYQYSGWYFGLIKSDLKDRERCCRGLENVLLDMAQHYRAARNLRDELKKLV